MFRPSGIYPAMLTPFHSDVTINEEQLRQLVDFQIAAGVTGLFPVASVGEGVHMRAEEKMRCMDIVVSQAAGRVPVTPGVPATHPKECIALAQHAKSIGCDAIVVTPPYFFKPDAGTVENFFLEIADNAGLPVILYNIPLFTQPLPYDVVGRLACHPNIVAMKDSSGSAVDFLHFQDSIRLAGANIAQFTGREDMFLPALLMGAEGSMTATTAVLPEVMSAIWQHHLVGETARAFELQRALLEPIRVMFPALPVVFKMALDIRGFNMGEPVLPLDKETRQTFEQLRPKLEQMLTEVLAMVGAPLKVC